LVHRPHFIYVLDITTAGNPEINSFVEWTSTITMVSFTAEVIFKLVAQGHEPWRYFTDSVSARALSLLALFFCCFPCAILYRRMPVLAVLTS